jgi:hypothetical protein
MQSTADRCADAQAVDPTRRMFRTVLHSCYIITL